MTPRICHNRQGFTLIEIVIAVAIVAIFAAAMSPMVFRHLEDAKVGRAEKETGIIANAVLSYYKDTGAWPYTNANGPTGNAINRVVSGSVIATGWGPDAASGAGNWGTYGTTKQLGDYLYYNNPDDDSSATGASVDQDNQDWPTFGKQAWKGPYVDSYELLDPWGNAYVINTHYLPGGPYTGTVRHKVFVLSAGPNGRWETGFNNAYPEEVQGDDVGALVAID